MPALSARTETHDHMTTLLKHDTTPQARWPATSHPRLRMTVPPILHMSVELWYSSLPHHVRNLWRQPLAVRRAECRLTRLTGREDVVGAGRDARSALRRPRGGQGSGRSAVFTMSASAPCHSFERSSARSVRAFKPFGWPPFSRRSRSLRVTGIVQSTGVAKSVRVGSE